MIPLSRGTVGVSNDSSVCVTGSSDAPLLTANAQQPPLHQEKTLIKEPRKALNKELAEPAARKPAPNSAPSAKGGVVTTAHKAPVRGVPPTESCKVAPSNSSKLLPSPRPSTAPPKRAAASPLRGLSASTKSDQSPRKQVRVCLSVFLVCLYVCLLACLSFLSFQVLHFVQINF